MGNIEKILSDLFRLAKSRDEIRHFARLKILLKANDWEGLNAHIAAYQAELATQFFSFFGNTYFSCLAELKKLVRPANEQDRQLRIFSLLRVMKIVGTDSVLAETKKVLDEGSVVVINGTYRGTHIPPHERYPLLLALALKNKALIEYLVSRGASLSHLADPNIVITEQGGTALHIACELGLHDLVVELLAFERTNINIPRQDKMTPLHLACEHEHAHIAKLLIVRGANVNAGLAEEEITPFVIAVDKDAFSVADLMIKRQYKVKSLDLKFVKQKGIQAFGLFMQMKRPLLEMKHRIMETSLCRSMLRYPEHTDVNSICDRIFTEFENQREEIRQKLNELYDHPNKILRPLLKIAAFAAEGKERSRPVKWIITQEQSVESLTGSAAFGLYNKKNSVYVAGGNRRLLMASFLHETKHLADAVIFGSPNISHAENDHAAFLQLRNNLQNRADAFLNARRQNADVEDKFIYTSIASIAKYPDCQRDAEVLVKVPEIIGFLGMEKGVAWLEKNEPDLLAFYVHQFNRASEAYLDNVRESRANRMCMP